MSSVLKVFCVLIASLTWAHASEQAITLKRHGSHSSLEVRLEHDHPFTKKLVDVLTKSPKLEEVVNDWVRPGTVFRGEGLVLTLGDHFSGATGVVLAIEFTDLEASRFVLEGNFVSVTSSAGGMLTLHDAILESRSPHALTAMNPGRIGRHGREAAVLERDLFFRGTHQLNCLTAFNRPETSICSINLRN